MDKTIILSIVAKNGLDTAQAAFRITATRLAKRAEKAAEQAEKDLLLAQSKKTLRLIAALNAAETGLEEYLSEVAAL